MSVRCSCLEKLLATGNDRVHGVTLQFADLHWLLPLRIQHARAFTQDRGRADARATLPQDVGLKNRPGRAAQVAGKDLADKLRHIDPGGAGLDTGSIMAKKAART